MMANRWYWYNCTSSAPPSLERDKCFSRLSSDGKFKHGPAKHWVFYILHFLFRDSWTIHGMQGSYSSAGITAMPGPTGHMRSVQLPYTLFEHIRYIYTWHPGSCSLCVRLILDVFMKWWRPHSYKWAQHALIQGQVSSLLKSNDHYVTGAHRACVPLFSVCVFYVTPCDVEYVTKVTNLVSIKCFLDVAAFHKTRSSKDECSTGSNNHLRSKDLFRS